MVKFKKISAVFSVLTLVFFLIPKTAAAERPNNKFGIHIFDESDLPDAAALVNSSGGEWGYVTIVIREDERDHDRWQKAFDQMRRLKLIPIVRLATKMGQDSWKVPTKEEAVNWAGFLNSLNWPVKNRYIVLFNEPNHAKEWGGKVNPAGYAEIARYYDETLKKFSKDFFVMPAGMDLAATNSGDTMDAENYLERMHDEDNYIFTIFDGLAVHAYPNPGFSGQPTDTGKKSIQGFQWELNFLADRGADPNIPIFITETGWVRPQDGGSDRLTNDYKYAYENVWNGDQIKAVTPFLLNYATAPFSQFSWKNAQNNSYYPQYYGVQGIAKVKGKPIQVTNVEQAGQNIAKFLVSDSEYSFEVRFRNTGQSIWSANDGFVVLFDSSLNADEISIGKVPYTEPGQTAKIPVKIKTDAPRGVHYIKLALYKVNEPIGGPIDTSFTLVSPPTLNITAEFWIGNRAQENVSLTLYDDGNPVQNYTNLTFYNGSATIKGVKNIIPNKKYEVKISAPYFIPKKIEKEILPGNNRIDFGLLPPIDLYPDGSLDLKDVALYFINPLSLSAHLSPF